MRHWNSEQFMHVCASKDGSTIAAIDRHVIALICGYFGANDDISAVS
jgi:hypothetical protein